MSGIWIVRGLALVAIGIAAYLFSVSRYEGGLPAGCGAGSGCADVLTSRWAYVFGIPVTLPAAVMYLGVLGASLATVNPRWAGLGWPVLLTLAASVVVAALWFLSLQAFVLKSWCIWCLAEHGIGLALGGVILWAYFRTEEPSLLVLLASGMVGVFLIGLLAAAQSLMPGPRTELARLPSARNTDTGPGRARRISVLNGTLSLQVAEELTRGDPQAPHLIVVFFDYCCPHCREVHGYLVEGLRKYEGQYGLVLLPMPLDRECNPQLEKTETGFEDSCELARLALAVWKANRSQFAEFDDWLFESDEPRPLAEARARAESMVPRAALDRALADPAISEALKRNVTAYHQSQAGRVPVILSPEFDTIVGHPSEASQLFEILEKELQLRQN